MGEENEEIKKEVEDSSAAEQAFENMAEELPAREVEVSEEGNPAVGSLARRSETSPNLSDMQAALAMAFPGDLGDEIANKVMVGRISPDAFMALLRMMTVNDIAMSDPMKPVDVPTLLVKNYTLLTIGLDGKGRIDLLEIVGAVREQEELKGLAGLGM